jgi:hypothetical protein
MSLFSFGGIRFESPTKPGFGANRDLLGGKYGYDILRYPIDIGSTDKGHYIVIHVNEQKKTSAGLRTKSGPAGDLPTVYRNRIDNLTPTLGSAASTILAGGSAAINSAFGSGTISNIANQVPNFIKNFLPDVNAFDLDVGFTRTISRTSDTIVLYMPDTVAFTNSQVYSEPSMGGLIGGSITAAASAIDAIRSGGGADKVIKNLSPFIGSAVGNALGNRFAGQDIFKAGFAAVTGLVQNPMIEMIYSSPQFRDFRFEFMIYPRSEVEATEVQNIITKLQFHQAPEIKKDSYGFFLVPPAEFDIKFYYNGQENLNIPKISTCILSSIDLDYAPNGWAAYESVGEPKPGKGRTGMPVAIRLGLNFKETEYMTKDNFVEKTPSLAQAIPVIPFP